MNTVTVYRSSAGDIVGFRTEGHAGYRRAGYDIVCSAISTLSCTAVNAMETVAGVVTEPTVDERAGLLEVVLPNGLTDKQAADCQIILRTIAQGLADIQESYPEHIRIQSKEWRK